MNRVAYGAALLCFAATPLAAQSVQEEEPVEEAQEESFDDFSLDDIPDVREEADEPQAAEPEPEAVDPEERRARRMMSECPGRIFSTSVAMTDEEGVEQVRQLRLCGESSEPEAWIAFLENAKEQVLRMDGLSTEARAKLLDELDAEIDGARVGR